jgi:hypothetical protein
MGVPMGEFREKVYAPTAAVDSQQVEGYDVGVGGQLTMGLPMHRNFAFRFGVSGMGTDGTNTAAGYDTITLNHTIFSISGELQFFFDDAYWHRGPYIVVGASGDFERFEREISWESSISRKNRLGRTVGFGQVFSGSGLKFVLEASYHSTMTGKDPMLQDPPASDFLRINFGFAF